MLGQRGLAIPWSCHVSLRINTVLTVLFLFVRLYRYHSRSYHVKLCYIISYHIISYHIISCHIIICGHFPILLLYLYAAATHGFSRLFFFCVASVLVHLRFNDTTLLSTLHLMDYSLLLAAKSPKSPSRSSGQLSMGIIDYLRAYTMDKKVESTIKSLGTSLTQSHPEQPTIIHPTEQLWRRPCVFFVFHYPFFFWGDLFFENKRMNQKRVQNLQSTNSSILFYQHNFTWLGDIVYISLVKLTISLGFPFNHFQWSNPPGGFCAFQTWAAAQVCRSLSACHGYLLRCWLRGDEGRGGKFQVKRAMLSPPGVGLMMYIKFPKNAEKKIPGQ